jgi:hypothetical protein
MTFAKPMFPPRAEAQDSFSALAVAIPATWQETALRLATATERVEKLLRRRLPAKSRKRRYAEQVGELVTALVDLLDGLDPDPDLEPTLGFMNGPPEMDECEVPEDLEPSLGSFDRMMDHEKAWHTGLWSAGSDYELDNCDDEDADPAEESEPSGIADHDGILEQIGPGGWEAGKGGMV